MSAAPHGVADFDAGQAHHFLETLFAEVPGLIEVRTLTEGAAPEQTFAAGIDEAMIAVESAAMRRRNVYVGVATRRTDADGTKANIAAVRAPWLDADFYEEGDREAHEIALARFPLKPSLRAWSGGGEHDYWTMEEPIALADPTAVARFECVLRGLADVLGGDRQATDASRILRVPGTVNYPDARKRERGRVPAPAMILEERGYLYSSDAFEELEERGRALKGRSASHATAGPGEIREGARNATLTSLAGAMRRKGMKADEILEALRAVNLRCAPPLPDVELHAIAHSVGRYAPAGEPLTDTGNAERLIRLFGEELRHVHPWAKWLAWDGRRFALDTTGEIHRRAKATVRSMYGEAATLKSDDERKALAKWGSKSESAARVEAMIALARSEVPVEHETLDADRWALNVLNGTLNLRTGELREHERGDLLTKLAPVAYDPTATAPTWQRFLERILPDANVRAFLRRAVGYSLTGDTGEHVLLLLWGAGANGKSTFVETIMAVMGEYALRTPAETLLAKRDTGIPNDVARLRGARFVAAVESEEGRRLGEVRVKELTGGDTVSARFMRAEWFDFRPVCKLWLATNHRPQVRGTDEAIWRRIRLVPFTVTIPEAERDRTLPARLREELPGILAWAVQGCLEWQRDGLLAPATVTEATADYRAEQDVLGAFLADRCVVGPDLEVASAALYKSYREWAEAAGEKAVTQTALGLALAERGYAGGKVKLAGRWQRGWRGLGLAGGTGTT